MWGHPLKHSQLARSHTGKGNWLPLAQKLSVTNSSSTKSWLHATSSLHPGISSAVRLPAQLSCCTLKTVSLLSATTSASYMLCALFSLMIPKPQERMWYECSIEGWEPCRLILWPSQVVDLCVHSHLLHKEASLVRCGRCVNLRAQW